LTNKRTSEDLDLVERLSKLFVPIVSDTLDGYQGEQRSNRHLMSPDIRPISPEMKLYGIANTIKAVATTKVEQPLSLEELRKEKIAQAIESVTKGDVIVYTTSGCKSAASLGELLCTAISARGGLGAVTDGYIRDASRILWIKPTFPVFAFGYNPADSSGRMEPTELNVPIWCGGTFVRPGDFILGDLDGVVVIPREIAKEVISKCEKKSESEDQVRDALRRGEPFADVAAKFRVM